MFANEIFDTNSPRISNHTTGQVRRLPSILTDFFGVGRILMLSKRLEYSYMNMTRDFINESPVCLQRAMKGDLDCPIFLYPITDIIS